MRIFTYLFSVVLAMMVLVTASCGSSRSFSSRKYTAGNYVSHKHKPGNVSVYEQPKQEAATVAKTETPTGTPPSVEKANSPKEDLISTPARAATDGDKTALGMTSSETKTASSVKSTEQKAEVKKEADAKLAKREAFRKYIAGKTERKCLAYDDGEKALDPVALVSFILGIIGLVLNILAISVIVATAEYVFALLFIAGMVLGIIALVFGTQGLRRNRKNNTGTLNLVFSIIGTAFGAGAIITAFIFAFYTLILAISGL